MNDKITLILPMPPSANVYWRTFGYNDKKSGIARAATYVSADAKEYKNTVRTICIQNRIKKLAGGLQLTLRIFRPRKAGDLSNRIKVLEDSLQGFAYENDDQIIRIVAERFDDKLNPRAEVEIEVIKPATEQLSLIEPIKEQKRKKPAVEKETPF